MTWWPLGSSGVPNGGLGDLRDTVKHVVGRREVANRADVDVAYGVIHLAITDRAVVFHHFLPRNRRISSTEGFFGGFLRCSRSCIHRQIPCSMFLGSLRKARSSGVLYQWAGQNL